MTKVLSKTVYVLKYKNGMYVERDDSTGPMASGGYPMETDNIERATKWATTRDAIDYAGHFEDNFDSFVYPLTISYEISEGLSRSQFVWTECNHHCARTPESMAPEAKHYLDCPVWEWNSR